MYIQGTTYKFIVKHIRTYSELANIGALSRYGYDRAILEQLANQIVCRCYKYPTPSRFTIVIIDGEKRIHFDDFNFLDRQINGTNTLIKSSRNYLVCEFYNTASGYHFKKMGR